MLELSEIGIEDSFYSDLDMILKKDFKRVAKLCEKNMALPYDDLSKALVSITLEAAFIPIIKSSLMFL